MFSHASADLNKRKSCEKANRAVKRALKFFTCKTELGFVLNHLLRNTAPQILAHHRASGKFL